MNNYSYKQLEQIMEAFFASHLAIKGNFFSCMEEQIPNLATSNDMWPKAFMTPVQGLLGDTVTQTVRFYIFDRMMKDRENYHDVISDTQQILYDVRLWLGPDNHLFVNILAINDPTAIPLNNRLMDFCDGWSMDVSIEMMGLTICEIPLDTNISPVPSNPCFPSEPFGYSGVSGYSGFSGMPGAASASGYSGYSGVSGFSGGTGTNGTSGISGYSGVSGYSGYSGVAAGILSVNNGLNIDGTTLQLGGDLVENTTIDLDGSYKFQIDNNGTDNFGVNHNPNSTLGIPMAFVNGQFAAGAPDLVGNQTNKHFFYGNTSTPYEYGLQVQYGQIMWSIPSAATEAGHLYNIAGGDTIFSYNWNNGTKDYAPSPYSFIAQGPNGLSYNPNGIGIFKVLLGDGTGDGTTGTIKFTTISNQPGIYLNQTTPQAAATSNFALLGSGQDTYLNVPLGGRMYFTNNGVLMANAITQATGSPGWFFNIDIFPNTDDTFDIGSSSKRWKDLYLGSIIDFSSNLEFKKSAGTTIFTISDTSLTSDVSIYPTTTNAIDLGDASARWRNINIGTQLNITNNAGYEIYFTGAGGGNIYQSNSGSALYINTNGGSLNMGPSDGSDLMGLTTNNILFKSSNARILVDLSNAGQPIHRYQDGSGNIMGSISAASNNFYFDATLGNMNFRGTAGVVTSFYNNGQIVINDQTGSANNAQIEVRNNLNTRVGLMITGTTSQSANLQEWRSVTPTTLSFVDAAGLHKYSSDLSGSYDDRTMVDKGYITSTLANSKKINKGAKFSGMGGVITAGTQAYVEIPANGTITGWRIVSTISGSIVIDVWKDTYANFPPTVSDSIAGSEKPTLSGTVKNEDTSLTTWTTTTVTAGDWIVFNVDSATTVTDVSVYLEITLS